MSSIENNNSSGRFIRGFILGVFFSIVLVFIGYISREEVSPTLQNEKMKVPFLYNFNTPGDLYETGSIGESPSEYWWLDSGGVLRISDGVGKTIQGSLPPGDEWRDIYARENPIDTDNGLHPQNIFRLVSKKSWKNFREEAFFKVNNLNLSQSPNRNESNGLLLFLRYVDADNLYYAGLRVDGQVVIKKKLKGEYYVLAENQFIPSLPYDRVKNPNVLPKNEWIGLRGEIETDDSNNVVIRLYVDIGRIGNWQKVLETRDDGVSVGPIIGKAGFTGIRTDFMDVFFSDFKVEEI